jgi:hypothetical protein
MFMRAVPLSRIFGYLPIWAASLAFSLPPGARAQVATLDKGHQILIDRGLQIGGLIALTSDPFHLSTLQAGGFTMPLWAWNSDISTLGPAPGAPWGRWVSYATENDLTPAEQPYKPNLVQLQIGDEQDIINDSAVRAATTAWFNNNRANFPSTVLSINRPAGDGSAAEATSTANWIAEAQPDMISFDWYPFTYNPTFDPNFPNRKWNWYWYSVAQRYRRQALGGYIGATFGTAGNAPRPYATYLQTYKTAPAPDEDRRPPSDSEMRLQTFAALTMGYTDLSCFTYNSGSSTLFDPPSTGDNSPGPGYYQFKETARQARNLGPALTRLISKGAGTRFIAGRNSSNTANNPLPLDWKAWVAGSEGDPYITSISAANLGATNGGFRGDVLIGYFNPLIESYDGPDYSNELYFMITNGLSDPAALVADCRQEIIITFDFKTSGINSLLRLSRDTGFVEPVGLIFDSVSHYHLNLILDGGTGDLFKFNDGAPFVGFYVPEPSALCLLAIAAAFPLFSRRRSSIESRAPGRLSR